MRNALKGWHRPRGVCWKCGREFALSAPSGDWLQALFPRKHRVNGIVCEGTWQEVTRITVDEQHSLAARKER